MVKTASTMLSLGTKAPDFSLVSTSGETIRLGDFENAPALLVIFMCNHCPFVIHVASELAHLTREYQEKGVAVIGINANDAANYPQDSPEQMVHEVESKGYVFHYLFDEDQSVAKTYKAACTPDFYVFNGGRELVYRGQMDSSRPESGTPVTGEDLRAALDAALAGESPVRNQIPSIGCNIKWKPGNEPSYFDPQGVS